MKTHHTPGPWELRGPRLVTDKNGVIIAENISSNGGTSEANARLIATAPELLEALGNLYARASAQLDKSATHEGTENCKVLGDARAAIREATGVQP